jgi:hypothetical protein
VSEQTIEAPRAPQRSPGEEAPRSRRPLGELLRAHPWLITGVALVVFSAILVRWTNTRPGYDPYGWLNWGYQTWHGSLDLGGAPSWKPMTYLFDLPFTLFGHFALRLWMVFSVSVALSGSIFGGRIAYRLVAGEESAVAGADGSGSRRWPAIVAAVFAGAAVLGIDQYFHLILSVQSDPMIVSICLAAIDCHLSGHRRWAFWLGILGSLGRPEVWPFIGLYSLWLWREMPEMRKWLVAGWALIVFAWFGIPTITNGRPLLAGDLAEKSPRMLHESKIIGTFHRFTGLTYLPIQLLALGAFVFAILRRRWPVILMGSAVVLWMVVETAFVLHGWPGVPRYMFEPAGVLGVLAGIAVGWILVYVPRLGHGRVPSWIAVATVAVLVAVLIPGAISRLRQEHKDLYHERGRTTVIARLHAAIDHMGGASFIKYCGEPVTSVEYVSILAYYTNLNDGDVGHRPQFERHLKHPTVFFTQLPNGWAALPWHTKASKVAACSKLKSLWIYTAPHPGGVLVPRTHL